MQHAHLFCAYLVHNHNLRPMVLRTSSKVASLFMKKHCPIQAGQQERESFMSKPRNTQTAEILREFKATFYYAGTSYQPLRARMFVASAVNQLHRSSKQFTAFRFKQSTCSCPPSNHTCTASSKIWCCCWRSGTKKRRAFPMQGCGTNECPAKH